MPEGDTIHRAAAALRAALEGAIVTDFQAPRAVGAASKPEPGERIPDVEARGQAPADPVRSRNHPGQAHLAQLFAPDVFAGAVDRFLTGD